jgi:hypothetical protein
MPRYGIIVQVDCAATVVFHVSPGGGCKHEVFHLQACHRSRKNTIAHLMHHGVPIVDEELKAEAIFNHFDQILGMVVQRTDGGQVSTLDHCFSKYEVWNIIKSLTSDKVPGQTTSHAVSFRQPGRLSSETSCKPWQPSGL